MIVSITTIPFLFCLSPFTESFHTGFPRPTFTVEATNATSKSAHSAATPAYENFESGVQYSQLQDVEDPMLWGRFANLPNIKSETDISSYVEAMMAEIINSMRDFENFRSVQITREPSDGNTLRPDLWIVKSTILHVPFFVIEVKKPHILNPDSNAQAVETSYGQMFDYLYSLYVNRGVQTPYGMLTTYERLRICWLDQDCLQDELLERKTLRVSTQLFETSPTGYRAAVEAIAGGLWKGFHSTVITPTYTDKPSKYVNVFKPLTMTWLKFDFPLLFQMPHKTTKNFYVLSTFRRGIDGKAYHVASRKGCQCVVKFSQRGTLEKEMHLWEVVNEIADLNITTLNLKFALVMPYLVPLSHEEKRQFKIDLTRSETEKSFIYNEVIRLIYTCANKGICQSDASWRHIGWYKYNQENSLKLLDFGHVEVVTTPQEKQDAFNRMFSQLCDELNSQDDLLGGT